MKLKKSASLIAAIAAATATIAVPAAHSVTVGPGSPIRMPEPGAAVDDGRHVKTGMCSTGVPGTVTDADGVQHRVIITAGHCVNPDGNPQLPQSTGEIFAPTHDGNVRIGEVGPAGFPLMDENDPAAGDLGAVLDSSFNGSDYAFIVVDEGVGTTSVSQSVDENGVAGGNGGRIVGADGVPMTGVVDYRELKPGEVSVDNFGRPICSDGSRTGRNCGVQVFRVRNGVWAVSYLGKGDSGGNAYDPITNQAIGVNSMAIGPVARYQPVDQAIQDAYGVEDGKVNEHFAVEESTAPQSDFRTIGQDVAADQAWIAENEPAPEPGAGSLIPGLPELPELPLPQLPALQLQ